MNNDKSVNNDENEDRNALFISYNEDVEPDNADNDVNADNDESDVI